MLRGRTRSFSCMHSQLGISQIIMAELVSVVIPTRNRCVRLTQAIASVQSQTNVRVEIIVVDDASEDDTQAVVLGLAEEDPRIRYIRNDAAAGGGASRNIGAKKARGEFIAFLDDDEEFLPKKLEKQLALLRSNGHASAASCGFYVIRRFHFSKTKLLRVPFDRTELLSANILGGASVCMVRTTAFWAVGGFDPLLRSAQDWDVWLKLLRFGPIVVCDEPLVRYHFHSDGQITGNRVAEYLGRRSIHVRYRKEMTDATRRGSLVALIFSRNVLFQTAYQRRLRGLFFVIKIASVRDKFRYFRRAMSLCLPGF